MIKKLTQFCLFGILICGYSFANNPKDNITIPYQKSEFSIPDEYKNIINNYPKKWQRLSGYEYSALHWEQFVVVFINNKTDSYSNNHYEFMRVYEEDLDPEEDEINYKKYDVGTIILKESFLNVDSRPTTPLLLSGMIKRKAGYDPKFGDWEYFQSSPDGKIIASGNSKNKQIDATCVSCHSNINDQDFVFATHYVISTH